MFPAGVAHPVERHLAKVEVASSSLVTRSKKEKQMRKHLLFFFGRKEARKLKCSSPVESCLPPARRRQHHSVSSLVTRSQSNKCYSRDVIASQPIGWRGNPFSLLPGQVQNF